MTKTPVANPTEQICRSLRRHGVLAAIQPVLPGRRLYPPPCEEGGGNGRILTADN
jgi:hypothetical protein